MQCLTFLELWLSPYLRTIPPEPLRMGWGMGRYKSVCVCVHVMGGTFLIIFSLATWMHVTNTPIFPESLGEDNFIY